MDSSNPTSAMTFPETIEERSKKAGSRLVLALDLDYTDNEKNLPSSALKLLESTARYLCAVKLNFHLIIPLSLSELRELIDKISSYGLVSIADMKLNDIDNTNRVATEYLWKAGFSAVIVNPFAGYDGGLDVIFKRAHNLGKGVITLAYMSHKGAIEGFGLKLESGKTIFDLFLERANQWGSDGVILGATRPGDIEYARGKLASNVMIFSPGSGAQGGDPEASLKAGADYMIYGRTIVEAENPEMETKKIYERLFPWKDKR
ncbi:MAG: orotidine 5'-phosphate decarboxylase / HUMPS family protein [Nitrososphaerales archaeon]